MVSRVPTTQFNRDFSTRLHNKQSEIIAAQNKISTGLEVQKPSDDIARASTIQQLQSTLLRLDRHKQRIANTTNFLEREDQVLTEANNLLIRLAEVGEQAANETLSAENRQGLSEEVFQLRDALVSLGNTKYQGVYLFGGLDDSDPPFDTDPLNYTVPGATPPLTVNSPVNQRYVYDFLAANTTYLLGNQSRSVAISDTESIQMNTPGDQIFSQAISGAEKMARALLGYTTDTASVTFSNNTTGTVTVDTGTSVALDTSTDAGFSAQTQELLSSLNMIQDARQRFVSAESTSLGSRLNRLEQMGKTIENVKLSTETTRSAFQDADTFEAASELSLLNTSFEALLAVQAQVGQISLLNFL